MRADDTLDFELSSEERLVLRCGVNEWGGPARCTEELARAMGFSGVRDLFEETDGLIAAIRDERPLSRYDWCRVLMATEFVFISNIVGSGHDWQATTGLDDHETLDVLRGLQRRITREVRPMLGHGFGTRPNVQEWW